MNRRKSRKSGALTERKAGEEADESEKKPEIRDIGQKKIRRRSGRIGEKVGNREHWPTKLMEQKLFLAMPLIVKDDFLHVL